MRSSGVRNKVFASSKLVLRTQAIYSAEGSPTSYCLPTALVRAVFPIAPRGFAPRTPPHARSRGPLRSPLRSRGLTRALVRHALTSTSLLESARLRRDG